MEKEYKQYIKKKLIKKFEKHCKNNCLDFYSCGCILTAHLVMEDLMRHKVKKILMLGKATPEEAWESAMNQTGYHSGCSAGFTASIIIYFSPRGEEFRKWWNKYHNGTLTIKKENE